MNDELAKKILFKTTDDYNKIADVFSRTRKGLDPDLLVLKKFYEPGQKVLDLGCGNGRFSELINYNDYFGLDVSENLIEIAQNSYPDKKFQVQKPLEIPFSENFFDRIFCLAVFHHIPSEIYRLQYLKEMKRF